MKKPKQHAEFAAIPVLDAEAIQRGSELQGAATRERGIRVHRDVGVLADRAIGFAHRFSRHPNLASED